MTRAALLERAELELAAADAAQARAIEALRRGDLAAMRAALERRDRIAAAALAEFRKLETPAAQ